MTNSKPIKQKDYQMYADCIRSDQVPASDIAALMKDKGFLEWYKEKYLSRMQDEQTNPYIGDEYCIPDKIFVDNCFVMRTNVYMINRFSLLVLSPVSWFR